MPFHSRFNGSSVNGDVHNAGRGRQGLKNAAIGYAHSRNGVDATIALVRAAVDRLCQKAIEYVETLPGSLLLHRRIDLYRQVDSEMLQTAAIAYACSRHGADADRGMVVEGLAILCQAAVDFVELLPKEDSSSKRAGDPHFQLDGGVR